MAKRDPEVRETVTHEMLSTEYNEAASATELQGNMDDVSINIDSFPLIMLPDNVK